MEQNTVSISPSIIPRMPFIKPFTNFDSGHGFVKISGGGVQTDDPFDSYRGVGSMQLVTDGAGTPAFSKKSNISPAVDLTGKLPVVAIKLTNAANISELFFYFSSDNVTANWYNFKPSDDKNQLRDGAWIALTLSFGAATITGTPLRNAINSLQVRVKDDGTNPVTVKYGLIGYTDEATSASCTLTFDDGTTTQYTVARTKMDQYGMSGTLYAINSRVGTAGYLTVDQLREMQDKSGWDISAHTYSHGFLSREMSENQIDYEFLQNQLWLLNNGFNRGIGDLAYPHGNYDYTKVIPIAKKYFRTARAVVTYPETTRIVNPYALRGFYNVLGTTLATLQAVVTRAIANKEWALFTFHRVMDTPTAPEDVSTVVFTQFIDWLATQNITVQPMSEVLR